MRHQFRVLTIAALAALAAGAHAQDFPRRPVTMVVAAAPGGGLDLVSRVSARALSDEWKQPVVTDNRGGAGGIIGTELGAKAAPDGYTLLTVSISHSTNPVLIRKLPYDTLKDFTPISLFAKLPVVLTVARTLPVNNVAELVAYARAHPGKLNCASSGTGTSQHLACEMFKSMAKVDIQHVPYKAIAAAQADVIGGRIEVMFDQFSTAVQNARTGSVKALAITTQARSAQASDLPTMSESGLPGYEAVTWFAMYGPAGLPKDLAAKIAADLARSMARPEHRDRLVAQNFDLLYGKPEELDAFVRAEMAKWGKIIKEAGIQAD
jgi:tripartite-type tricarboxylate transporter receptor subunit TctC